MPRLMCTDLVAAFRLPIRFFAATLRLVVISLNTDSSRVMHRLGVYIQAILYSHYIPAAATDPEMFLQVWGIAEEGVPVWQKQLATLMLPILLKFISKVSTG
jgi:hypothetical protein